MANPGKAAGGAYERRGRIFLRVTIATGKRSSVALPWCSSLDVALERSSAVQALVDRLRAAGHSALVPKILEAAAHPQASKLEAIGRAVEGLLAGQLVPVAPKPGTIPVTVETFAKEWTDGDLHAKWPDHVPTKDAAGVAADARVFRKYINPEIGAIALERLTLEDVDRVLAKLPAHLAPASRRQVAQSLHRVLALACYPARHLRESPIPKGWLPKVKRSKAFTFVWPEELAALEACTEIPLVRRVFFGVLAREGMRRDELADLRWDDLDLQRGMLRLDVNKTDDPRAWALSPDVVRTLADLEGTPGRGLQGPGGPRVHPGGRASLRPEVRGAPPGRSRGRWRDARRALRAERRSSSREGARSARLVRDPVPRERAIGDVGSGPDRSPNQRDDQPVPPSGSDVGRGEPWNPRGARHGDRVEADDTGAGHPPPP